MQGLQLPLFAHVSTVSAFKGLRNEIHPYEISSPHHPNIPYVLNPLRTPAWCGHFLPAFGCRRIVRNQGYLQSLSRPNVRLTFDRITHVEPDGVITETSLYVSLTGRQCLTYLTFTRGKGRPRHNHIRYRFCDRTYCLVVPTAFSPQRTFDRTTIC